LAGALKDNNRAKLIGGATFGKGLVQKVYSLPNSTGINLTVARYLTPKGSQIDKIGIKPDFEVQFTKEDLIEGKDSQFEFAMNYLSSISSPL
jgi:carboxyl-terminal processing protease